MELQGSGEETIAWAVTLGSMHDKDVEKARKEVDR